MNSKKKVGLFLVVYKTTLLCKWCLVWKIQPFLFCLFCFLARMCLSPSKEKSALCDVTKRVPMRQRNLATSFTRTFTRASAISLGLCENHWGSTIISFSRMLQTEGLLEVHALFCSATNGAWLFWLNCPVGLFRYECKSLSLFLHACLVYVTHVHQLLSQSDSKVLFKDMFCMLVKMIWIIWTYSRKK